jgi:DNA-binding transcriptional LysR family regulator
MDYFAAVRAFLHAADLGSFSKAAVQMEVKTSTASRCSTVRRAASLTEGGRVFCAHALTALQHLDEARQLASSLNASPQGLLRVTMHLRRALLAKVVNLPAVRRYLMVCNTSKPSNSGCPR